MTKDYEEWGEVLVTTYFDEALRPAMSAALEKAVGRPAEDTDLRLMVDGYRREEGWWCDEDEDEVERVTEAIKNLGLEVSIFEFNEDCECRERKLAPNKQEETAER